MGQGQVTSLKFDVDILLQNLSRLCSEKQASRGVTKEVAGHTWLKESHMKKKHYLDRLGWPWKSW